MTIIGTTPPTTNPIVNQLLSSAANNSSPPGLIINQAISTPKLFHFGELWSFYTGSSRQKNQNRDSKWKLSAKDRMLLELFCFGTVQDYLSHQSLLGDDIKLNPKQMFKLRQLSLISLIHRSLNDKSSSSSSSSSRSRRISYACIASALGLANHMPTGNGKEEYDDIVLEEIIIACVYDNLIYVPLVVVVLDEFFFSLHFSCLETFL